MAPVYITIDPEATGRNIRVLMTQNGYDIDDVREACGNVSAQAVYKWLSGKSLPSLDNLKALSLALKTTMQSILVTDENALFLRRVPGGRFRADHGPVRRRSFGDATRLT